MKRSTAIVLVATAVLLVGLPSTTVAKTEIQFWHAMTAVLGERVNDIATKFNGAQNDYVVKAVHKGSYPETLNAAIAPIERSSRPTSFRSSKWGPRPCCRPVPSTPCISS